MTAHPRPPAPMRPISRVFRARQILADIVRDGAAACDGLGPWWSTIEDAHAAATSPEAAERAAAPAIALCTTCPEGGLDGRCALRAALDSYDGLAAGEAWVDGRPRSVAGRPRRRGGSWKRAS